MLFNSNAFIFGFLPIVLILFHICGQISSRCAIALLALASLVFYAWDSISMLPILILSIALNYICGQCICSSTRHPGRVTPRVLLTFGITANVAVLSLYKYTNLLIDVVNKLFILWDLQAIPYVEIYLPTGISFFTFTQIAYLIDCYRHRVSDRNPVDYTLFVSFFPHLIAGPLLHHRNIISQLPNIVEGSRNIKIVCIGIAIFSIGLAKKILIADNLAHFVDAVYSAVEAGADPMLFISWIAMLGYTFQIYFDFSGYSDMAIGLALLFGIVIPINFNSPYQATGFIDFWHRWHISLSNFLRDYLYIPLGGNRSGERRKYVNIFVTMLIGGLWHGASWTFALWGAVHGVLLILNHLWRRLFFALAAPKIIALIFTFAVVNLTWILFRSQSWEVMEKMLRGVFGLNGISVPESVGNYAHFLQLTFSNVNYFGIWQGINGGMGPTGTLEIGLLILASSVITLIMPNTSSLLLPNGQVNSAIRAVVQSRAAGIIIAILFWLSVMNFSKPSPFLYFRF